MPRSEPALLRWLRSSSPEYYAKAMELRTEAEKWLTYIPNTFPHYTRHTIDHSDEIVRQVSFLLFRDGRTAKCAAKGLSATEAFVIVAAAYLHDAGMVVSEAEKAGDPRIG